jgi:hypothetical protein
LWRIDLGDGGLSDLVNLPRAKDAAIKVADARLDTGKRAPGAPPMRFSEPCPRGGCSVSHERIIDTMVNGTVPAMAERIVKIEQMCGCLAGAVEHLAENVAAHAGAMALIELATNAPAIKARILELQRQTDQLRDQQSKLAGEREALERDKAEHAAKVKADEAALDKARDRLRETRTYIEDEAIKRFRKEQSETFVAPKFGAALAAANGERTPEEARRLLVEGHDAHFRTAPEPHFQAPAEPTQTRPVRSMRRVSQ